MNDRLRKALHPSEIGQNTLQKYFRAARRSLQLWRLKFEGSVLDVRHGVSTGEMVLALDGYGGNTSNMVHHKGVIYFTAGGNDRLYAVDADTGEKIWEERPPERRQYGFTSFVFTGVALDPDKGYLYVTNRAHVFCLELARK